MRRQEGGNSNRKMASKTEILNTIIHAMRSMLGDIAVQYAQEIDGLIMKGSSVVKVNGDELGKIAELVAMYQGYLGNAALIAINEALEPLMNKDKKVLDVLPQSLKSLMTKEKKLRKELGGN